MSSRWIDHLPQVYFKQSDQEPFFSCWIKLLLKPVSKRVWTSFPLRKVFIVIFFPFWKKILSSSDVTNKSRGNDKVAFMLTCSGAVIVAFKQTFASLVVKPLQAVAAVGPLRMLIDLSNFKLSSPDHEMITNPSAPQSLIKWRPFIVISNSYKLIFNICQHFMDRTMKQ